MKKLESNNPGHIALTELSDGKIVSTIFLHFAPAYGSYETMVFPDKHNFREIFCKHSHFEEDALKVHGEAVKQFEPVANS